MRILPFFLLLLGACSLDTGIEPPDGGDTSVSDTSTGDASDSGLDADPPMDTSMDTIGPPMDTGSDTTPGDTSTMDADTGTDADTGPADSGADGDTGPADTGTDTGPADTGPADTGPADTGPADTGPPPRVNCDDAYGGERSYLRCDMRAGQCEFYVDPPVSDSCDNVCARGGGTCVRRFDELDDGSGRCTRDGERGCSESSNDYICICTRPFL